MISIFKKNLFEYEEINSMDLNKIVNLCKGFTYDDIIAVCKFIMQDSSNEVLGIFFI